MEGNIRKSILGALTGDLTACSAFLSLPFLGNEKSTAVPGKKLYTVLPPPQGYLITSGDDPVTLSNPDSIDSENSPVGELVITVFNLINDTPLRLRPPSLYPFI